MAGPYPDFGRVGECMRTSEQECLAALREAAAELGESPTKAAYEGLGLTPASGTIMRVVGGWNEAKERAGLETYRSNGPRVQEKPEDVDLPESKEWEELSVDQRWHYRNKDWNTERSLKRRAANRSWVNEQKAETGCEHCGETAAAVLDFHHRNPAEKEMAIGEMVTYGYGKEKLRQEMENCNVLCANCHRRKHFVVPDSPGEDEMSHRRWIYEYKLNSDGCQRCEQTEPASLVFHHTTGEKRATIARLVADEYPRTEIETEIEKCELLCANCHRREHFEPPQHDD